MGFAIERRRSRRYPERKQTDLDFANDIAQIGETPTDLQRMTDRVVDVGAQTGVKVNAKKTKSTSAGSHFPDLHLKLREEDLDQVPHFTQLGSAVTEDGTLTQELNCRKGKAADAFIKLQPICGQSKLAVETKMKIFNSAFHSTLIYASET